MRNAHINEVLYPGMQRSGYGFPSRNQIDASKFGGLRWAGMSDSNQLYERCGRADRIAIGIRIERVPEYRLAPRWQFDLPSWTDQRANDMTPGKQARNQAAPDVSSATSNKYALR